MRTRTIAPLALAAALTWAMAVPAGATGATITRGSFHTLQGGVELGYDISGSATMRRLPAGNGTTFVSLHVSGLDPSTTYPTHVHNAPCDATPPGGSHYQHEVGGPVDSVNEMWPVVSTRASGNGTGFARHDHWARPDARSIVIHYPENTAIRLACADLD